MRAVMRWVRLLLLAGVLAASCLTLYALLASRPQDLPWTKLDLEQPIGLFTGRKLATLTTEPAACRALLDKAGISYVRMAPGGEGQCVFADAVRLRPEKGAIIYVPRDVAPSCPVAAALKLWEWNVVQPAAQKVYGRAVARIEHLGSYNCRRMYGRTKGDFSEHVTADAIDISGFVLADGRRITVHEQWDDEDPDADFLREVRDGACRLFSTVLSPDYNAAHRDHLHLDQAERGSTSWRACR